MLKYPAKIHNDPDGLWIEFIGLPISGTQGENMEELLEMAEECLSGYLEVLLEEAREIPDPIPAKGEDIIFIEPAPDVAIPILAKKLRNENGLTQDDMAKKLRVSYQTYQKLERGHRSNFTLRTMEKVAKAFGKKLVIDMV